MAKLEMATLKGLSLIHQPHLSVPLILLAFQNRAPGLHCTFFKIQQRNLIYTQKTTNLQAQFTVSQNMLHPKTSLLNH